MILYPQLRSMVLHFLSLPSAAKATFEVVLVVDRVSGMPSTLKPLQGTFNSITAESLRKDVRDLKATCLKIILANGGYPEAHW